MASRETNYAEAADEDLSKKLQSLMKERAAAETAFREQQLAVQFELDKRAARARFGTLSEAEVAALQETLAERE